MLNDDVKSAKSCVIRQIYNTQIKENILQVLLTHNGCDNVSIKYIHIVAI